MRFLFFLAILLSLPSEVRSQACQIADQLKFRADSAIGTENWALAATLLEKTINAEKECSTVRQENLYNSLSDASEVFFILDSLEKGLNYGLEAYSQAQKTFTAPNLNLAHISNLLGNIYTELGDFKLAELQYLYALKNIEDAVGKDHSDYAILLHNLARLKETSGQYQEALSYYKDALENTKSTLGEDHYEYALLLSNLAGLYESMSEYDQALPMYIDALKRIEKALGRDHPQYGSCLNNLGYLYVIIGEYQKALPLYIEALEIAERVEGKNHPEYGLRLNNLAYLYDNIGEYDKALALYLEALENTEKNLGKEHQDYGIHLNNLASLYEAIGQYDKALTLSLEALQNTKNTIGEDDFVYAIRLNNLAHIYNTLGRFDDALPLYLEALEIGEQTVGKSHPNYAVLLNNLASLYSKKGDFEKSLLLYEEALKNTEESLGKEHLEYGVRLNNIARLYEDMGDSEKALELYLESLDITKLAVGDEHPYYGVCLFNLSRLYAKEGVDDKSYQYSKEHIIIIFNQIEQSFSFMTEKEKEEFYKTIDKYFDTYLSFYVDQVVLNPEASGQTYNIELALKGLILNSSIQMRDAILSSKDSAAIHKFDTWELQRVMIAEQYSLPISQRRADLPEFEVQTQYLESELTRLSKKFSPGIGTGSETWEDVQKSLQPNEAAIEFSAFNYYRGRVSTDSTLYYAHVLLPGAKVPISVLLFEEAELAKVLIKGDERNRAYVQRIYGASKRGASLIGSQNAIDLSQLIWEPLKTIIGDKERVYFSPAGLLHRLNLGAIQIDSYTSLADKIDLIQLGSTADIISGISINSKSSATNAHSPGHMAIFGGLQYSLSPSQPSNEGSNLNRDGAPRSWNDLPYTLREVESIGAILSEENLEHQQFTGPDGSEENFMEFVRSNREIQLLHFATHGYFFERDTTSLNLFMRSPNPLFRSGLILAEANESWAKGKFEKGKDDGILTAYEISQLDLRNTELVVLSACETGLGDISNSEGVYGLQRAFKLAGVKCIIMTLWQVPDKQSKVMMEKFYRNWIEEDQSIPDAFKNAQAEMREIFDTYEWAGFVLVQ